MRAFGGDLARLARNHRLAAFFGLTFTISWGYWIPVALSGGHVTHFPGLMGPMLAALVLTPVVHGRAGTRDLLARMAKWRVPLRWYAAVLVPGAVALVALGIAALAGVDLPSWGDLGRMPGLPEIGWVGVFVLTLVVNGYGEETGWRGFAWPELRRRHSLSGAALILAVPWAVWHIPTFFVDSGMRDFPPALIPGFLVGMVAGAVVLGWMYEACGSIFVLALWHTMLNMASATEGAENVAAAVSAVVIVWAIAILRREHARGQPAATAPSAARPLRPRRPATGTS